MSEAIKCKECGKFFNGDFGVCPYCGAVIEEIGTLQETETPNKYTAEEEKQNESKDIKTEFCRFCGKTIVENSQFCSHCGKELRSDFMDAAKTTVKNVSNIKSEFVPNDTTRIKIKVFALITMVFSAICGCIVLFSNWFNVRLFSQLLYGTNNSYGHYGLFDVTKLIESLSDEVDGFSSGTLGFACVLAIGVGILAFVSIVRCIWAVAQKNEKHYIKGEITTTAVFSIITFVAAFIQGLTLNSFVSSVNEVFNDIDGYRFEIISLESSIPWLFVASIIGLIFACILFISGKNDPNTVEREEVFATETENNDERIKKEIEEKTDDWIKQNTILHEDDKDTWMCPMCARILPNNIISCPCGYDKYGGNLKV